MKADDPDEEQRFKDGPRPPLVLIASVGGSPDPIVTALRVRRPDFVLFVASFADGAQPGSADQVAAILDNASLPALPHEILLVPPDDPEKTFLTVRERIHRLKAERPDASLVIDYTGGTKSMTGALFQCAVETPEASIQFMLGVRNDLKTVTAGTERPTPIPIQWIVVERMERSLRRAWARFDYAAAANGASELLKRFSRDATPEHARPLRDRLKLLQATSRAFDLWDSFRHDNATRELTAILHTYGSDALRAWKDLCDRCAQGNHEPARLLDLVRNAERCAARGRYDDAVARLYRLVEWTAQWRLKAEHGIDSSNVDWSRFTEAELEAAGLVDHKRRSQGHKRPNLGGLERTLATLRVKEPDGPLARWLSEPIPGGGKTWEQFLLRELIPLRNKSILAHGEQPVTERAWDQWRSLCAAWCEGVLFPLLRDAREPADLPPQLPQDPTELGF